MDASASALVHNALNTFVTGQTTVAPFFSNYQFWILVAAVSSSIIALLVSGGIGKYIAPFIGRRSHLEVISFRSYRQSSNYWRLSIKNTGNEVARNVQVEAISITDNGIKRGNFLAVPLRWTHHEESRDIFPGQTAYLDTVVHDIKDSGSVNIATRFAGGVGDFRELKNGRTVITLSIFEENSKPFNKKVVISWPGGLFLDGRIQGRKWYLTKTGKFF